MFECQFCKVEWMNKRALSAHEKYCHENPNRINGHQTGKQSPFRNHKHSQLTKVIMSEKATGRESGFKNHHHTDETKDIMRTKKIGLYDGENNPMYGKRWSDEKRKEWSIRQKESNNCWDKNPTLALQHRYETMKRNNTFNSSKIECELKNYFNSNNILYITQYKNNLYPFCCDFYFPDKDLYVEIQGHWSHGNKPYISTDEDCINQLELWKSKNTKFYDNAISTWTERDVKKRTTAKINNLNWIEIFSIDFNECLKIILDNLK